MPFRLLGAKPFFDDKNHAFWVLQSAGWTGYFVLRSLGGLANNMGLLFVVPTALSTATGYSLTLLMASAFRRLIWRSLREMSGPPTCMLCRCSPWALRR